MAAQRVALAGLSLLSALLAACGWGSEGSLLSSEVVVADAAFPAALAFAPDGRLFYTERLTGNIRVVSPEGQLLPDAFGHLEVATKGEWGLLGLAIDPEFLTNHYLYVYYMRPVRRNVARPQIVRFTDRNGRGADPNTIFRGPRTDPPNINHVGGNIHFGPDGYLYVSIGDFGHDRENAQDLSTVKGKILRVDKLDGSPAVDNPVLQTPGADRRIFAYGVRNSFDFAFHPHTGGLYASENGPDRCDELNIILPGEDYGWPAPYLVRSCVTEEGVQPIYSFARAGKEPWEPGATVAPTGLEFVSGDLYPELNGSLLACDWNTGTMRALRLGGPGTARVLEDRVVVHNCRLDIAQSPNGVIYYSNEEEIRRLLPGPARGGTRNKS